jgi:hypothetical protein
VRSVSPRSRALRSLTKVPERGHVIFAEFIIAYDVEPET